MCAAEYGLTFPALLSWLYDVEDEESNIHDRLLRSGGGSEAGATDHLIGAGNTTLAHAWTPRYAFMLS